MRYIENAAACGDYSGRKRQVGQGERDAAQLWACARGEDRGNRSEERRVGKECRL